MKTRTTRTKRSPTSITWFGHSAFRLISPSGRIVFIDPWLDNPKAPPVAQDLSAADLILVTHGHCDHVGNTIALAARTGAAVIGIHELALHLQARGVKNVAGMNKGGTLIHEGIAVTMVDAKHSGEIDTEGTVIPGGEAAGFVVRMENGLSVYHAGDTSVFGDMKLIARLYKPSVAMLPIGGLYTMDPTEASLACQLLDPGVIIGMHYGTFPALVGTPAALRNTLPSRLKSRVRELTPGIPVML